MEQLARLILFAVGFMTMLMVATSAFEVFNNHLYSQGHYDAELYEYGHRGDTHV